MEISKKFSPRDIEDKWYKYWIDNQYFNSFPNAEKEAYCVLMPPPNVTGVLHMGHMLNNTIQDVLVRKARMEGKEVCWVPGTDHASIATEAKVVQMLRKKGIGKRDLSRQEFLDYCWEWTHQYGGIILQQLRKLGASCDWNRTRFTMDKDLYSAVIESFIDLHQKGYVYRGNRIVNWDPDAQTTLSDEEIIHKEQLQPMYYIRYKGEDCDIIVATVRPETIMADVAIAVHPKDIRYQSLIGKTVRIPIIDKEIPIIADEHVKMDFGTGCLKITPAHSADDYKIGQRHQLPIIDIFNPDGTLNSNAQILVGLDRFEAREQVVSSLQAANHIVKVDTVTSSIGYSERTQAVVEPRLSEQWFLKMNDLSQPAYENVMNNNIKLVPPKFKNTYKHWMEKIQDWCISRQLWWGHQIPAFYTADGQCFVAKTKEAAIELAKKQLGLNLKAEDLTQDEDVLDTWFSSWLWPITVFDGFKNPNNEDINYYYPTNDLVTAPEILFFWVARMIIAGYEFKGDLPFRNVYLTGIVRDKEGKKMSKSLGNSPDPIELIEKFGADGVRTGMLFSSPAGNDLLFDEKLCEQGRNFCNKIWNAFRLVKSWEVDCNSQTTHTLAIEWFSSKLNATIAEVHDDFGKFRLSEALNKTYKLIWDDFCSQYLEMIKPPFGSPIDKNTYDATIGFFEKLMTLAHPFMPFISEEIWQELRSRQANDSICIASYPSAGAVDMAILQNFEILLEIVSNVRNIRNTKGISPKQSLPLRIKTQNVSLYQSVEGLLKKLANIESITFITDTPKGSSFIVKVDEFLVDLGQDTDIEAERTALQNELDYVLGFKKSVEAKLSNEQFLQNAKAEVVDKERQKLRDIGQKISHLDLLLEELPS